MGGHIDPKITSIMEEVERHREESRKVSGQLQTIIRETMQLSGVRGVVARITGRYERHVQDAEMVVAVLREELAVHRKKLAEAEDRLDKARAAAKARAEELAALGALGGDTAQRLLDGLDELEAVHRLDGIEQLQVVLKRARQHVGKLERKAQTAATLSRSAGGVMGQLATLTGPGVPDQPLGEVGSRWEIDLEEAEELADRLGVLLALPRVGDASAQSTVSGALRAHAHPDSASARRALVFDDMNDLAKALERATPELDGLLEQLREAHREIVARYPEAPGQLEATRAAAAAAGDQAVTLRTPAGNRRQAQKAFVRHWERLLDLAEQLDRAAVPTARTADLLGPMAQWNQAATAARELGELHELSPLPPLNQGGDLHGFVDRLRGQLPQLREQLHEAE
mgnify:CR=1 FL=1